jgi:hypothetical protein
MAEGVDFFWLEIEMLPTDSIQQVKTGRRKRHMICPKGKGMAIEMSMKAKFLKTKDPVGLAKCSKHNFAVFNAYRQAFAGSGRKFATSINKKGRL